MKRLLALILAFAMLPVMAVYAEEQEAEQEITEEAVKVQPTVGSYASRAQGLLSYLKIGSEELYESEVVTRAEFAKVLAQVTKQNITSADIRIYSDVSVNNEYYPYIYRLAVMNIMNGYDDSTFKPNEGIGVEEAYVACINALGYKPVADISGGYFKGYKDIVSRLALNKGLKNIGSKMSGYDTAILIYNMLNSGIADFISDDPKTLLEVNFDMKGYVGDITQIGKISLSTQSKSLEDDTVVIDGVTYAIRKNYAEKVKEYIGCKVEFYIRDESNEAEAVLIMPHNEIKTVTVLWDEIEEVSVFGGAITIEYYKKGDNKSSRVKLETGASMILNDRAAPIGEKEFDMPNTKTVFADTDNDGKYEVARVARYSNMVVSAIDTVNEAVYGKYDIYKSEELHAREYEVKIIQNGTTVGMRNIEVGDILSIYVGGKGENMKKTVVINRDNNVSGVLKSITEDGYIVDETEYLPAYDFMQAIVKNLVRVPKTGENVTLLFDAEGRIAEIKYGKSDSIYAFIINAKVIDEDVPDEEQNYTLHVFNEDGEWKDYELREEKVYFNDEKMTPYEAVKNNLKNDSGIIYQLLKLKLNENEKVTRIYTAKIPANDKEAEKLYIDGVFTQTNAPLERYYSNKGGADVMFAENPSTPKWGYGEVEDAKVDFAVSTSTKVIKIPSKNSPAETMRKEDLYSIGTGAMFPRWEWAYTVGYDSDRYGVPKVLVWYQPEGKESGIMMVSKTGMSVNEETDEIESYIEVMTSSGTSIYKAEDIQKFDGLKKGDIIKVKCDMENAEKRHVTSVTKCDPAMLKNGTVVGVSNGMIRILPKNESKSVLYAITAQQAPYFDGTNIVYLKTASLKEGTKILYNEYYGAIRSYIIID